MDEYGLIGELELYGVKGKVLEAIGKVRREEFVLERDKGNAYGNYPLPIGHGQTISQPLMVAEMTEVLELERGMKVLEVGAGSGYQAAIIKELVGEEGEVVSIEKIPELAKFARGNLKRSGYEVEVVVGDGTLGYEAKAPYDRIMVTAGAPDVPERLVEQLKVGGLLVIPVGGGHMQALKIVRKVREGWVEEREGAGCVFVKLIGEHGWPKPEL